MERINIGDWVTQYRAGLLESERTAPENIHHSIMAGYTKASQLVL